MNASARSLSAISEDAYLHVLVGDDKLTLVADHDYCRPLLTKRDC